MNDEIKEILEHLKNEYWRNFPEDGIPYKVLYAEEVDSLLDYIINLQQELKEANDSVEWWTNRFKAVQQENERLKNEPLTNKLDRIDSVVANIYRNNKEKNDYKSRCEKAIEYIKQSIDNSQPFYEYLFGDENGKVENLDKLLNILQNGSE